MGRSKQVRATRALEVVEAAYSLDDTDQDWLARVLEIASHDVDLGLGTYAFTCRVTAKGLDMGTAYVERRLLPKFAALVGEINRTAPPELGELLARSVSISGGLQQVVGQDHPTARHLVEHGAPAGVIDGFSLFAQDGEGWGVSLTAVADHLVEPHPRVRGIWRRVGLHLAASTRLRRRLRERAPYEADAILAPRGVVEHAPSLAASARDTLKQAVKRMERARTKTARQDPERALELWRGLVAGEWSLVDRWESDGRRYVAAYRNRPEVADPRALTGHERAILHYAARGASNKEIGFALGLPSGAVATGVSQLLRKLRCRRRSDLLPFASPANWAVLDVDIDEDLRVASARFDVRPVILDELTAAEREIARLLLRGATNIEMARARQTSPNTIAKQLRALFTKLDVTSRTELVRALTRGRGPVR
jgi:DNA-binding NarL/FixJ family response regulator